MPRVSQRLVGIDAITAAAGRLAGIAQRTPVETSRAMSAAAGVRTLLKCEHLQRTGSFKIRGAYNRIVLMAPEEQARSVVCASAGNHAQGVALSAQLLGVRARVFMPAGAPLPKVEATRGYGAEVVLVGDTFDDAFEAAEKWTAEHDAVFVHPFDHLDLIAGQGTLGLELLEQVPDVGTVVVPIGGGGLIAGVAAALKARRPQVRVVGVEAAGAASVTASLEHGTPTTLQSMSTIADGIAVKTPGALTLAHIQALVDDVVTVTDEAIARAVLLLVERAKQVVEPSGAAGLAAVLQAGADLPEPVVAVLCGGNVDPLLLARIIQSGMYEEGRYAVLRTTLQDRPGALSALLALLADVGANIVAVEHHRLGTRLGVLEVEVQLEVETRGAAHVDEVTAALRSHGYPTG
jgi:threonine dehydratase